METMSLFDALAALHDDMKWNELRAIDLVMYGQNRLKDESAKTTVPRDPLLDDMGLHGGEREALDQHRTHAMAIRVVVDALLARAAR